MSFNQKARNSGRKLSTRMEPCGDSKVSRHLAVKTYFPRLAGGSKAKFGRQLFRARIVSRGSCSSGVFARAKTGSGRNPLIALRVKYLSKHQGTAGKRNSNRRTRRSSIGARGCKTT